MKKFLKISIFPLLILLIFFYLFLPVSFPEKKEIYIPKGFSRWQVAKLLKSERVIRSASLFYIISILSNKKIISGEYSFKSPVSLFEIITKIDKGMVISHRITIPEGFTAKEIARTLENHGITSSEEFLKIVNSSSLSRQFKIIPEGNLEGFLFPDTYYFSKDTPPEEIVKVMLSRFEEVVPADIEERARKLKLTLKEVITLASLVEKEAKKDNERRLIAGVLYNRIRKNMKLECDATVQYALGKHKIRILYKDLKINSPYNTYLYPGLPPGPICNPGLSSIKAALEPASSEYLFYVAKPDGSHFFSKTYSEHLRAKKKYLLFSRRCIRYFKFEKFYQGMIFYRGNPYLKKIALTFDDGPHPENTPKILDILDEYKIKGNFFLVGNLAKRYPEIVKRIHRSGHLIGNHTYTHRSIKEKSIGWARGEIEKTHNIIKEITGEHPYYFRPPQGIFNPKFYKVAEDYGEYVVMWSIDTHDYKKPGVDVIVKNVLNNIHPGAIVLFHDGGGDRSQTIKALPEIIKNLKKKGYTFSTLSEILIIE